VTDGEAIAIPDCVRASVLLVLLVTAVPARGQVGSRDPARGHYLLAPSAFLLRGGEIVVSQTEALLTSAAIGIADHVDLTLGSAAPVLSMAGSGVFNLTVALKGGTSFGHLLHVAAGFQTLSFPGVTAGYTFAVTTVGHERLNLSVGVGVPVVFAQRGSLSFGDPMAFAAGVVGIGRHVALASENWWFPTLGQMGMVNAALLRFDVWRVSIGLGAARVDPLRIPMPWFDLAVRVRG
jgi:hypothetical protein